MATSARTALLLGLLGVGTLLVGCPGMPGVGGGAQEKPPGMSSPPGLQTGGAWTMMGTTITPPENSYMLVSYEHAFGETRTVVEWQTCRRIIPLESCVLVEGLNHDERLKDAEKDVNRLLPFAGLVSFEWKYERRPAPPPGEQGESEPK